jgi:HEAT repeat protein
MDWADEEERKLREEILGGIAHHVSLLADEDPSIRANAARKIGEWSNMADSWGLETYHQLEAALAEAVGPVASLATDDDPGVRRAVADCFWEMVWPDSKRLFQAVPRHRVMTPLISLLGDEDEGVRTAAASAIGEAGYRLIPVGRLLERAIEPLIGIIGGEGRSDKVKAMYAIGSIAWSQTATTTEPFVMPLIEVLRTDASAEVRARAANVARKFNEDERIIEQLIASLEDDVAEVRCEAASALVEGLWELGSPSALDVNPMIMEPILSALLGDLEDEDEDIRKSVIGSLVEIEDERALEAVSDAVKNDPSQSVREYAARAMKYSGD